jgi:hypothetical protein
MNAKIGMQFIGNTKNIIRAHRTSKSPTIRFGVSLLYRSWYAINTGIRACVDKNFRSILLLQLVNSKNVHQTTSFTYMDRYPTIFSACRDYLKDKQDLKILSYGCSTGEEVLTLRRYFPNAHIIGTDINKHSLEVCRKLPVDDKISFIYSKSSKIQQYGPFDAVFCMGVLQRKPHYIADKGSTDLKKIYPFEKFEQQIMEFDHLLNPNGLLIVHFTQYSLMDTKVASEYKVLGNYNQSDYSTPVFDKHSNLIQNPIPFNSIFIKRKNNN